VPESKRRKSTKPVYTPPPVSRAKAPSPPWYGALMGVFGLIAVTWLVVYTLGPAPGQAALGGWNYAIALGLVLVVMIMITNWR
jgi:hypothetical protein